MSQNQKLGLAKKVELVRRCIQEEISIREAIIDIDTWERMTANYEQEQRELMQSVAELEHSLASAEQDNVDLRAFLSIIRKSTDLQELTPELVNRLITKIEVFVSTKDENGKKHVPIKVHFIGVGILEIPDTQTITDAKEEIRKNPPKVA